MSKRITVWRTQTVSSSVAPPRLADFDWRVDTKVSADVLSHMSIPTLLVNMNIQEQPTTKGQMPGEKNVQFELDQDSLATLLDGLEKIKDQLAGI